MVCRDCGRVCYRARLADGTVAWVSHMHPPFTEPGTLTCPEREATEALISAQTIWTKP